jgi:hypothetical protein
MENKIYVRLDADNIGEKIELALLNNDIETARLIHEKVQSAMNLLNEKLENTLESQILMRGCDDILFVTAKITDSFIGEVRETFFSASGYTISIGIGSNLSEALRNLQIAKLSGKNKVVQTQ